MLKWLLKRRLKAFEKRWGYDTGYMRTVVDEAGVGAVMPMNGLQGLKYRRDIPVDVYYGATLTAGKAADCGPCLQLGVKMAEDAGVSPQTIRAILAEDRAALSPQVLLGIDLAKATIARDFSSEQAREEIVRRWGMRALMSIAYGIVSAQAYPTIKYAIGYGKACSRVKVGGIDVPVHEVALA